VLVLVFRLWNALHPGTGAEAAQVGMGQLRSMRLGGSVQEKGGGELPGQEGRGQEVAFERGGGGADRGQLNTKVERVQGWVK